MQGITKLNNPCFKNAISFTLTIHSMEDSGSYCDTYEKLRAKKVKSPSLNTTSITMRLPTFTWECDFLGATKHLYKRVCPSVRPSVRPSVGPSVTPFHLPSYRGVSAHLMPCIRPCSLCNKVALIAPRLGASFLRSHWLEQSCHLGRRTPYFSSPVHW